MLVLVVIVERYIARHDEIFTESDPASWSYSARAARREAKQAEVLCLGSSLMKFGVQSRAVQKATGLHTFNLAVYRGSMPSTYFLLEHALQAGARPAAVLIDGMDPPVDRRRSGERPDTLQQNMRTWPELLTVAECFDLSRTARDAGFFASVMLAKALPTYKARFEIRNDILAAMRGASETSHERIAILQWNWVINQGTHVCPRRSNPPRLPDWVERQQPEEFSDERWARNKLSLAYAKRFLDLATAYRIKVFWVLPPVGPEVLALQDRTGVNSYVTRTAHWAQVRSDRVVVIDGLRSGYRQGVFADIVHLDRQGGATFTHDLAEVVKHSMADPVSAPHWVVLPSYRDLKNGVPIEDLSESLVAWALQNATRR